MPSPAKPAHAANAPDAVPAPVTLRVFLVEDFHNMRDLLLDLFSSRGPFQVMGTAETEAEANLWLEEFSEHWDLLVTDLVLAQGSGMNVLARAKALKPQGRVVVLSGYATEGIQQHCLRLGAERVFDKADTPAFVEWLDQISAAPADAPSA
jgi:DNA-binding NarL/FixJ family response regulator